MKSDSRPKSKLKVHGSVINHGTFLSDRESDIEVRESFVTGKEGFTRIGGSKEKNGISNAVMNELIKQPIIIIGGIITAIIAAIVINKYII